jgi:hypothetical protein
MVSQVTGSLQTPIGKISVLWEALKGSYIISVPVLATVKIGVNLEDPANSGCGLERVMSGDGRILWELGKVAYPSMLFVEVFS